MVTELQAVQASSVFSYKCIFLLLPKGFVTMVLQCSIEMRSMSYAWRGLKEQLGEEIDGKISAMRFLKGKMVR